VNKHTQKTKNRPICKVDECSELASIKFLRRACTSDHWERYYSSQSEAEQAKLRCINSTTTDAHVGLRTVKSQLCSKCYAEKLKADKKALRRL
jgi:hypothetical protein